MNQRDEITNQLIAAQKNFPLPNETTRQNLRHFSPANPQLGFVEHVIAGAVAGLAEVLVMYPLDVVKTRFQLQTGTQKTSVLKTLQTIVREEGARNLYRGILSPILAEAPKRAIKFSTNESYKKLFTRSDGKLPYSGAAAAGALAGMTEAFVNCPFEVVKVRLQSTENLGLYKNTFDATVKIARNEGPLALYRGFEAQLWRNAAWNGTYFALIPICKESLWKPQSKGSENLRNFLAGFIAGSIATSCNTPFDVVKSRLQNYKGSDKPWALKVLSDVYRNEGIRGCYKGFVPRILRLGPGGGIMLLAFDFVSAWILKMKS